MSAWRRAPSGDRPQLVCTRLWLAAAALLSAGCLSLDPFLFSGVALSDYQLDAYTGEQECPAAIDSVRLMEVAALAPVVVDSCIHQFEIASGSGSIHAVLLSAQRLLSPTDTCILYFHGKGPHIDYYWDRTRMLHATGFPVMIVDYRGFGMSAGTATEATLSEDGHAALAFLRDSLGDPRITVYGYSMGSLVACDMAAHDADSQIVGLILEAPIGSIQTLVNEESYLDLPGSYFTTFTGDNAERIRSVSEPFLWMHGSSDEVLDREAQGLPIWRNYQGSSGYSIKVLGAGHTTVPQHLRYGAYVECVRAFCRGGAAQAFPQWVEPARGEWAGK